MWPGPIAVKSVMNKLPPLSERLMPANKPPPVWVFIWMLSDIHAMQLVWLYRVSPAPRSTATVCMVVPDIS
jgi:hypothetical protein